MIEREWFMYEDWKSSGFRLLYFYILIYPVMAAWNHLGEDAEALDFEVWTLKFEV